MAQSAASVVRVTKRSAQGSGSDTLGPLDSIEKSMNFPRPTTKQNVLIRIRLLQKKFCVFLSRITYAARPTSSTRLAAALRPPVKSPQAESHLSIVALACHFQEHPSFAFWALPAYRQPPSIGLLSTLLRRRSNLVRRDTVPCAHQRLLLDQPPARVSRKQTPSLSPQRPKLSIPVGERQRTTSLVPSGT